MPLPDAAASAASSSLGGVLPTLIPHLNALFAARVQKLNSQWQTRLNLAVRDASEDAVRRFQIRSGLNVGLNGLVVTTAGTGYSTRSSGEAQDPSPIGGMGTGPRDMRSTLASQLHEAKQERARLLELLTSNGASDSSMQMRPSYGSLPFMCFLLGGACLAVAYSYALSVFKI